VEQQLPNLIFLRPVFTAHILFLLALFLIIIFQKKRIVNLFTVISISLISSCISALNAIAIGYIADEYGLVGDPVSFYLFLTVVGLSFINIIVYLLTLAPLAHSSD
jgi:hypothetical protein